MAKFLNSGKELEARQVPTYDPETTCITEYLETCLELAEWCGGTSYMMGEDDSKNYIWVPSSSIENKAQSGSWILCQDGKFYIQDDNVFHQYNTPLDPISKNEPEEERNLVLHARRELELFLGDDSDAPMEIELFVKMIKAFSEMGHSGSSAMFAIPMINDLLQYKNLSPINDDPQYWMQVEMGDTPHWQSTRNSEVFSTDGGKTHYYLSEVKDTSNPWPRHVSRPAEVTADA